MSDVAPQPTNDVEELVWQATQKGGTRKQVADQFALTPKEVSAIVKRKRAQRDERIFQASGRGHTIAQLALDFGMSPKQIAEVIKARIDSVKSYGLDVPERVADMRLAVLRRALPGWSARMIDEADQSLDTAVDGKATAAWLNLVAREASYIGADKTNVTVSGDPDNPVVVQDDTAEYMERQLKTVLAVLKPYPEIRAAVLEALAGDDDKAVAS